MESQDLIRLQRYAIPWGSTRKATRKRKLSFPKTSLDEVNSALGVSVKDVGSVETYPGDTPIVVQCTTGDEPWW